MLWPWLQASARTWPLRGGSQSKSCRVAIGNCPTLEWKPFRDLNETIGNHLESIHITVYIYIYLFIYWCVCVCVSPFENHHFALGLEAPFFLPWTALPMSFTKLWISMASCSLSRCPGRRPLETAGFLLEKIDKEIITSIILSIWYIYISMHM